jgi:hypothetical protein
MFKKRSVCSSSKKKKEARESGEAKGLADGKRWKMDTESKCLHWTNRPKLERSERRSKFVFV